MQDEELHTDPLFAGLTRPATVAGVPLTAFVIEALIVIVAFLASKNIFTFLLAIPLHGALYALSAKDSGIFHELLLAAQTNAPVQNRSVWEGAASFSPLKLRKGRKLL